MNGNRAIRLMAGTAVAAAAILAGCGGGGADTGSGTLRVSLTDAPACGGYDAVYVTVSKVRVHSSATAPETQGGWSDIDVVPPKRVDLVTLANGVLLELGQTALPAGKYQQIRLVLADNATTPFANAVMPTGGAQAELETPSGQQSGIKLQANVDVPAGQTVDVVLDFDACRSVVRRGNSGRFNLKPVIAVVPMISVGAISGYAAADAPAADVKVSAQSGGVVVKETVVASGAKFNLAPIAAGNYDVVFTAAGHVTRVVAAVPAFTAGDTVMSTSSAPIALPVSATGAVGGTVTPADALASVRALQAIGATAKVEVASVNADALSGAYAFTLPTAAIELASPVWPAPPITAPPAYAFTPVAGTAGLYTLGAAATGYVTTTPAAPGTHTVTVPDPVARDFTLSPAP